MDNTSPPSQSSDTRTASNEDGASQAYTEKFQDLLSFLDKVSSGLTEQETGENRRGLCDISNDQEKKTPVDVAASDATASKTIARKREKYIWEIFDEESENTVVKLEDNIGPASNDDVPLPLGQKRAHLVLPGDARKQLSELRNSAEKVAKQFASMKNELKEKRRVVENLHKERLAAEKSHNDAVKTAKQLHDARFDDIKRRFKETEHEHIRVQANLEQECVALNKRVETLSADIATTDRQEKETIERLKREGESDLQKARLVWQHAEKEDLKKRDRSLAPRLKKDAAKQVEPKLKAIIEGHEESIVRLERQTSRDIERYKLELYRQSQERFRCESKTIRSEVKKSRDKQVTELLSKLALTQVDHERELNCIRNNHSQRMQLLQKQHDISVSGIKQKHVLDKEDMIARSESSLEQMKHEHKCELTSLDEQLAVALAEAQTELKREHDDWVAKRSSELELDENSTFKTSCAEMRKKAESEVDLVRQKLKEEQSEKVELLVLAAEDKNKARQASASRLQRDHRLSCAEGTNLERRLAEISAQSATLDAQLFDAKSKTEDCEDKVETIVARMESCDPSGDVADLQKKQARGERQALADKSAREAELAQLLAQHPKIEEERTREEAELRLSTNQELAFAERKVKDMLKSKQCTLDQATAFLQSLREQTNDLKQKLDSARRKSLSDMTSCPSKS